MTSRDTPNATFSLELVDGRKPLDLQDGKSESRSGCSTHGQVRLLPNSDYLEAQAKHAGQEGYYGGKGLPWLSWHFEILEH